MCFLNLLKSKPKNDFFKGVILVPQTCKPLGSNSSVCHMNPGCFSSRSTPRAEANNRTLFPGGMNDFHFIFPAFTRFILIGACEKHTCWVSKLGTPKTGCLIHVNTTKVEHLQENRGPLGLQERF